MPRSTLLLLPWLMFGSALAQAQVLGCDALLADIDTKIRASGASNFVLEAVDAEAPSSGRVVGSCGQGRKKIVYTPGPGGGGGGGGGGSGLTTTGTMSSPIVRAAAPPRPPMPAVMTECKPGYTGADCSRRIAPAPAPQPSAEGRKPASAP